MRTSLPVRAVMGKNHWSSSGGWGAPRLTKLPTSRRMRRAGFWERVEKMTNCSEAKGCLIRNRDIFLHDGQHLRRVRLTVAMQALLADLFVGIIGWSCFATARM